MIESVVKAERAVGSSWVGPIPNDWDVARVKHLSTIYSGGTPDRENRDYWDDGTIPWLNSGEVNQWLITEPSTFITEAGFRNSSAKWIPMHALVMALAGQGKTKGMVAQLGIEATCNQSMAAIVPGERVHPRLMQWWLHANYETIRNLAGGEQRDGLNLEIVGNIPCPVPSTTTQAAIADYLDRETARLDALVAAKERVLELLAEKRRALITRAVTRGLAPRAPVRDSGIPRLGEMPAHWRSVRLRFLIRHLEQGWSPEAENREPSEDEWGVLKLNAVSRGRFDPSASKALPSDFPVRADLEVRSGDFLVTRSNTPSFVGDACFVSDTRPRLMLCDLIYRLTLIAERIDGRFLSHFLTLPEGRGQIETDARGTSNSMVKISQEHIKDWRIPVPPLDEQRAIVGRLDPETGERYTVKRYESVKTADDAGSWRHTTITLKPVNPGFQPLVLTDVEDSQVRVVAEVIEVLGAESGLP